MSSTASSEDTQTVVDGYTDASPLRASAPSVLKARASDGTFVVIKTEGAAYERTVLEQLQHPAIVPALPHTSSLVRPFVHGAPLSHRVVRKPFDAKTVLGIANDLAQALQHAHARGILHGRLEPGHVLITRTEPFEAKLIGFGLTGPIDDPILLTSASVPIHPAVAPEQLRKKDWGPAADIFAFGTLLFLALTGKYPQSLARSMGDATKIPHLDQLPHLEVPTALSNLVAMCLESEASARPSSARELVEAIASMHDAAPQSAQVTEPLHVLGSQHDQSPPRPPEPTLAPEDEDEDEVAAQSDATPPASAVDTEPLVDTGNARPAAFDPLFVDDYGKGESPTMHTGFALEDLWDDTIDDEEDDPEPTVQDEEEEPPEPVAEPVQPPEASQAVAEPVPPPKAPQAVAEPVPPPEAQAVEERVQTPVHEPEQGVSVTAVPEDLTESDARTLEGYRARAQQQAEHTAVPEGTHDDSWAVVPGHSPAPKPAAPQLDDILSSSDEPFVASDDTFFQPPESGRTHEAYGSPVASGEIRAGAGVHGFDGHPPEIFGDAGDGWQLIDESMLGELGGDDFFADLVAILPEEEDAESEVHEFSAAPVDAPATSEPVVDLVAPTPIEPAPAPSAKTPVPPAPEPASEPVQAVAPDLVADAEDESAMAQEAREDEEDALVDETAAATTALQMEENAAVEQATATEHASLVEPVLDEPTLHDMPAIDAAPPTHLPEPAREVTQQVVASPPAEPVRDVTMRSVPAPLPVQNNDFGGPAEPTVEVPTDSPFHIGSTNPEITGPTAAPTSTGWDATSEHSEALARIPRTELSNQTPLATGKTLPGPTDEVYTSNVTLSPHDLDRQDTGETDIPSVTPLAPDDETEVADAMVQRQTTQELIDSSGFHPLERSLDSAVLVPTPRPRRQAPPEDPDGAWPAYWSHSDSVEPKLPAAPPAPQAPTEPSRGVLIGIAVFVVLLLGVGSYLLVTSLASLADQNAAPVPQAPKSAVASDGLIHEAVVGPGAEAFNSAVAAFAGGELQAAMELFHKSYEQQRTGAAAYNIGRMHVELGQRSQAQEWFQRVSASSPEHARLAARQLAALE